MSFSIDSYTSSATFAKARVWRNRLNESCISVIRFLVISLAAAGGANAQAGDTTASPPRFTWTGNGIELAAASTIVRIDVLEDRLLHIHMFPASSATTPTLVLDPAPHFNPPEHYSNRHSEGRYTLSTGKMTLQIKETDPYSISVKDSNGELLLQSLKPLFDAHNKNLVLQHAEGETLYGMLGLPMQDNGATLIRNGGAVIRAGIQGEGGAPYTFTTRYGVLVDSDGGDFTTRDDNFSFHHGSRPDVDFFIAVGPPVDTMGMLSRVVGPPPLPPKWTLGFLNSQWGADEAEVKQIADRYRAEHLPVDGFILDFDWKAWGEDSYGEWRWNSTSGRGAASPDKFPDGASGVFAANLERQGIKLAGILKPRILTNVAGNPSKLTEAAQYAEDHHFWYPGEVPGEDYFTHRGARNLDFNNPAMRSWFWEHLKPAFSAGMVAWWNDEADYAAGIVFNNFQFLNMGRALYEGQRATSNLRVWSINRNFYLGSSRYGYAGWSGDISTGFESMAYQRRRMLAALNTGEFHWSMDTGGFAGHPTDENYARWLEFAAFVPIMRVHGENNEKRQPWVYGPTAEAAARSALELRYTLMPYIYSYERRTTEGEAGLVRPLLWEFPLDPKACADTDEWMFGDALLVSPVVTKGATTQHIYLPDGEWFDYDKGKHYSGHREIELPVDSKTWKDIPLFVRAGSILATQPLQQYVGEGPVTQFTLDIFPAAAKAKFMVYDDDGKTYAYEQGVYLRQNISAVRTGSQTLVALDPATGSYASPLDSYMLRIHTDAQVVMLDGKPIRQDASVRESGSTAVSWTASRDKFGSVILVRVPAGTHTGMRLTLQ